MQIFVKVDGSKVTPMEVSLKDDKDEDVMRRIQNDEDAYVTMLGRALKRSEKLKSCGVTDGCTIQVTSRLRGGGKYKDKKGQKEMKQAAKQEGPEQKTEEEPKSDKGPAIQECDKEAVIRMLEENEEYRGRSSRCSQKEVMRNTGYNTSQRKSVKSQGWTRAK